MASIKAPERSNHAGDGDGPMLANLRHPLSKPATRANPSLQGCFNNRSGFEMSGLGNDVQVLIGEEK